MTATTNELQRGEYVIPPNADLGTCASCGSSITWTTTAKGKPMPLSLATGRSLGDGRRAAMNHFSDCPHWPSWSGR